MAVGKTAALGEIGSGTLAILGCGKSSDYYCQSQELLLTVAGALGTAILLGLLSDSLNLPGVAKRNDGQNGWSKAYRFVACVRYDLTFTRFIYVIHSLSTKVFLYTGASKLRTRSGKRSRKWHPKHLHS